MKYCNLIGQQPLNNLWYYLYLIKPRRMCEGYSSCFVCAYVCVYVYLLRR